ncbi:MAG: nuclear transport factor 2 family protein [Longimicrobiales bacterium]
MKVVGRETASVEGMRLTGVLEKRNGTWLMVHFHGSVPVSAQIVAY